MAAGIKSCAFSAAVAVFALIGCAGAEGRPGDTEVMKWRDGKKAVFLLAFDDSCQSHVRVAIPELRKRGMVGTFYINPGKGPFQNERKAWEEELPKEPAVVYGNHTFAHVGATNAVQLDEELARCDAVIKACYPGRKPPRLVSFGQPGGVPWSIAAKEKEAALAKYHLVERPPFFGYPFHVKTASDLCGLVDKAIAAGGMGHNDFHGVGGDWLVTPTEVFKALLDKLESCRDDVWVTDHITYHKYLTERGSAQIRVVESGGRAIRLRLNCQSDPALYDAPLTLETRVPADWKACRIAQGAKVAECLVKDGRARYEALPGGEEIVVSRR